MNHGAFFVHAVLRYKEPLALTDCLTALDFCGPQARNRCPYVVNTLTRHGGSEPVALIEPKQKFVSGVSIPDHQHHVPGRRLYIQNFGYNAFLTSNVKEFARAIPADINSDLRPLGYAVFLHSNASTHTGEVPTEKFLGLHTTPYMLSEVAV